MTGPPWAKAPISAALKLVAALGLDPVKGLEALKQLLAPKPKDGGQ